MLFRRLYEHPTLYQDWNDRQSHRKVGWSEAFYDLLFVVASMNVAHRYHQHVEAGEVGLFFLYFSLLFMTWMRSCTFHTRFKTDSLLFDFFGLMYFLATLGMVVSCQKNSDYRMFAVNYAIVTAVHALCILVVAAVIERVRRMCLWHAITNAIVIVMALGGAFISFDAFVILTSLSILVDWVSMLTIRPVLGKCAAVPLHVDHMSERFGLITMIFLGESVVSIGLAILTTTEAYVANGLGATLIWTLHLAYYNCHPDQDLHAMRISVFRGFTWTASHWLMGAAMLSTGAGLRLTLELFQGTEALGSHHRHLLGGSAPPPHAPMADRHPSSEEEAHHQQQHEYSSGAPGTSVGVPASAAWVLCASYAITLTLVALTRASHYMSLPSKGNAWREHSKKHGLASLSLVWWLLAFLWPQLPYAAAGARLSLTPTTLLGALAAHGLLFIVLECCITHYLSTRPGFSSGLEEIMGLSIHCNGPAATIHQGSSNSSNSGKEAAASSAPTCPKDAPPSTRIAIEVVPPGQIVS